MQLDICPDHRAVQTALLEKSVPQKSGSKLESPNNLNNKISAPSH